MTDRRPASRRFARVIRAGVWVSIVLLAAACGGGATGGGQAVSDPDELPAAAAEEGTVTWYSSLPENYSRIIAEAFTKKHGIKVDLFVTGSVDLQNKVAEEIRANRLQADVFHSSYPPSFVLLKEQGSLARYDSPQFAHYPAEYVDPDHAYGTFRATAVVLAYNPEALQGRRPPQTWQDLVKPEYKGLLAAADPQYGGTQLIQNYMLMERYGEDFLGRLGKQEPLFVDSQSAEANLIVTGERAIGIDMNDYEAWNTKYRKNAPMEYVYPSDWVAVVPGYAAVLQDAPHPNAARLFFDFLLSEETQQLAQDEVGAYSARTDAEPIEGRPAFGDLPAVQPDWEELAQNTTEIQDRIAQSLRP